VTAVTDAGAASDTSGGDPAISLRAVTKRYAGTAAPAVDDLSLEIAEGEIVVLIGPSGCGKTTTLRMINRLIDATSGTITVAGTVVGDQPAHELRRHIGYVIQQVGLFPHRTIAQNIATVPKLLKWDRSRIAERVDTLVDLVGLDRDMLPRYPSQLSGGQQQRVGVARALAADPPVLLMDEPFGAVDPIVRARLQDELLDLQTSVRKTIVLVTHDVDEAIKLADRIAVLNVGGILEQYGPPDELLRAPANDFVAEFLGAGRNLKRLTINLVGDLERHDGSVVDIATPTADALAAADAEGTDWVGATADGCFLGWAHRDDLPADAVLGEQRFAPPAAKVRRDSSLGEALEVIISSQASVAVVVDDDDRFAGVVSLDQIRKGLQAPTS
jgi:osmoprotectant transport system ATP-binding protein